MAIIQFEHVVTSAEVKDGYLTLSFKPIGKKRGIARGKEFGLESGQDLVVIDGHGRRTSAKFHQRSQVWGRLRDWFSQNSIQKGSKVQIRYDPDETTDGLPVVHLEPVF